MPAFEAAPDLYQTVTDAVLAAMDQGVIPWKKPWAIVPGQAPVPPSNLVSRQPYRGVNLCLLSLTEYTSPYWLTYKQAQEKGGHVRKGEKSTLVVFWKVQSYPSKDDPAKMSSIPLLRHYRVFNSEQCDGLTVPALGHAPEPAGPAWDADQAAETLLTGMPDPPSLAYGGDRAFYAPGRDHVQLPERFAFATAANFYGTAFHELTHATGHSRRLDRAEVNGKSQHAFGSEPYGREELCAEMGAAFLCAAAGLEHVEASASYIEHWRRAIRADKKLVIAAAGRAQRAADWIKGVTNSKAED